MKKAGIIAGVCLVLALSVAPIKADIILEVDVSNPTIGFSITDVSGGALSPVLDGGDLIFDNFFASGDGGGNSTFIDGDLRDSFFEAVVGGDGLIGSGTQLFVDPPSPTHQFSTTEPMFIGGPTNTFTAGLIGTFPSNNTSGDILLTTGGGVLGQWQVVNTAIPEPSSMMILAMATGFLCRRRR